MQRKILVSCVLARWTYAWNVRRKRSASSWVWQLAAAPAAAATTRRYTRAGDRRIMCSWTRRWCHRQSTHRSRREGAGERRTLDRRGITRLPVSRPLRSFRARFLGRVSRCIVGQLPQQSSVPPRPSRSRTTRTRIPRVASIPPGEDPLSSRRILLTKLLSLWYRENSRLHRITVYLAFCSFFFK